MSFNTSLCPRVYLQEYMSAVSSGGTWKREEAEKRDSVSDSGSIESIERKDDNRKRTGVLIFLALLLLLVAGIPVVFRLLQKGNDMLVCVYKVKVR